MYQEPTHDMTARDTSVSKAEGTLKEDYGKRRKKNKLLKKTLKKYGR